MTDTYLVQVCRLEHRASVSHLPHSPPGFKYRTDDIGEDAEGFLQVCSAPFNAMGTAI